MELLDENESAIPFLALSVQVARLSGELSNELANGDYTVHWSKQDVNPRSWFKLESIVACAIIVMTIIQGTAAIPIIFEIV